MKRLSNFLLALAGLLLAAQVSASPLMMVRSTQSFPEAMLSLQTAINKQGYTVSRVQRVDIGLTSSGYQTDKYRVVFLGKPEEIHALTKKYPELIPYLPWKIVIFAERDETLVVTHDPENFTSFFPGDDLAGTFARWHKDLQAILERVRAGE
jgi:uncharacterized protein (DUF302 family)